MNAFDELTNQIKATEEIIEACKASHQALGLPEFISELEMIRSREKLIKRLLFFVWFNNQPSKFQGDEHTFADIPASLLSCILLIIYCCEGWCYYG